MQNNNAQNNEESTNALLKIKKNIELLQSSLNEISNCKITTNTGYEENTNNIINMYNSFFSIFFISSLSSDLKMIQNKMNEQILKTCNHELEKDYVDTYPERSIPICYCTKCYLTFE